MEEILKKLEAVLFFQGMPMSRKKLQNLLSCSDSDLEDEISKLKEIRSDTGVVILDDGVNLTLVSNPNVSEFIEGIRKVEATSPLSKASQETLSIISYAGPISKFDLDFLRGVNTQYTIRRLFVRGLIREEKQEKTRLLSVTTEFLSHTGVNSVKELEDYDAIRNSILNGLDAIKKKMGNEDE